MDRRTFLKVTGIGSVAFAAGCSSETGETLFSLVNAPDDMVTGEALWYASTCRECPAGCGVLAKNREGRVIKLEGNPDHPINRGRLCMRGQAALQSLYNPDRLKQPLLKDGEKWHPISFEKATALIREKTAAAAAAGPDRVRMLTEVVGESLQGLFTDALARWKSHGPIVYEPFAYESLKFAHQSIFGLPILPGYRMDRADFLLGFGADFLETWLSPVEYAAKFKAMHALKDGNKGRFVQVSPFQTLTGANADLWLACRPNGEGLVALWLLKKALAAGAGTHLSSDFRQALARLTNDLTAAKVARKTDIKAAHLERLADRLLSADRPLVLGACTAAGETAAVADLAAAMLNILLDADLARYDFDNRHRVEVADKRSRVLSFFKAIDKDAVDVLFLHQSNPLFTLPPGAGAAEALRKKSLFTVALTSYMDETAAAADLVFPVQHFLETWDTFESKQFITGTLQPAMGKIYSAPAVGDLFLEVAYENPPVPSYKHLVAQKLTGSAGNDFSTDWLRLVQKGGRFLKGRGEGDHSASPDMRVMDLLGSYLAGFSAEDKNRPTFMAVPSVRFFDGRGANKPLLCEIPDPLTQVAWQTTLMVHPSVMKDRGWKDGDKVTLRAAAGKLTAPVYGYPGLHPSVSAMSIGQGHTAFGRYARNQGINPLNLLEARADAASGGPAYAAAIDQVDGAGQSMALACTSGSPSQHGRAIALSIPFGDLSSGNTQDKGKAGLTMADFPFTPPTPEGYDRRRDFYPPHEHDTYRWGMVVDLDRCIGCGACVSACYAENNVGIVGEERILEGREMAWLRIERYHDPVHPARMSFLPMMCQHCDNAPCEAVCPVYAPHHSRQGLNNQIYNRCIGTRFCAQNCPYKVRRFNWYDWKWPEPLPMQLNPNVTVRSKGVMEKCSFCVQRIKDARQVAKDQERNIRDGEVSPACVQTCPAGALAFGSFMDPVSRVSRLIKDPRAYQVMGYLNTKPAVIYLKKVVQEI
jgi:anaerobic selenocysteine-containing dehydrogenase/Fe-S-cluster-containing dehydrogenase component